MRNIKMNDFVIIFLQYIIHMKLLIIDIEEMIINDNDINNKMKKKESFINISFMIDSLYNIIVYEKYEIELSFK